MNVYSCAQNQETSKSNKKEKKYLNATGLEPTFFDC